MLRPSAIRSSCLGGCRTPQTPWPQPTSISAGRTARIAEPGGSDMTALRDPLITRLSRRAVLAAPAGFAAPIVASAVGGDAVAICRAWLANKAEMMGLLVRWGDIEDQLVNVHGWSLSDNA